MSKTWEGHYIKTINGKDYVLHEDYLKLEQKIDKAIKILKEAGCYDEETKTFCDDIWEELPDILNALEGSDK